MLGENRYRAHRYREAAQYLAAVADHPDAERLPEEAAEAVYHGALAELKLRRPERALPLLEAAVRIHPQHTAALGLLAERALERRRSARGLELLERQAAATRDPAERALRFERVADAMLAELNDTERAVAPTSKRSSRRGRRARRLALLEKTLRPCSARAGGSRRRRRRRKSLLASRRHAGRARAAAARSGGARRRRSARSAGARAMLQAALELDPLEHETLGRSLGDAGAGRSRRRGRAAA